MKKIKFLAIVLSVCLLTAILNGCALLVVGGAGGAVGYEAAKNGYTVQSPVVKK